MKKFASCQNGGGGEYSDFLKKIFKNRGFTLVELLVVIAIIGILIGLLLPAVQAAREAARRMQCVNNLKQFGLAVHNFHDVRNGIPPAGVGENASRASFWVLILPYMEQQNVFDLVSNKTAKFKNNIHNNGFWNTLSEEERRSLTVDGFFCPSRRAPTYLDGNAPNNGQGGYWGPQGDYAFVIGAKRDADSGTTGAWFTIQWKEGTGVNAIDTATIGPIRLAKRTTNSDSSSWYPRDNMAWWQDGTSNQIIIGEKFIPQDYIGKCDRFETDGSGAYCLDCSMYTLGGHWTGQAVSRSMYSRLANSPNDYSFNSTTMVSGSWYADGIGGQPHWGGTHAGVANFLLGDGSVKAFANTTPTGFLYTNATTEAAGTTTNSIIGRLGHVCDGNPIPAL